MGKTTYNTLVSKIVERAKKLADEPINMLRLHVAVDATTFHGAIKESKHLSRGELIESILDEEFSLEFDTEIDLET